MRICFQKRTRIISNFTKFSRNSLWNPDFQARTFCGMPIENNAGGLNLIYYSTDLIFPIAQTDAHTTIVPSKHFEWTAKSFVGNLCPDGKMFCFFLPKIPPCFLSFVCKQIAKISHSAVTRVTVDNFIFVK